MSPYREVPLAFAEARSPWTSFAGRRLPLKLVPKKPRQWRVEPQLAALAALALLAAAIAAVADIVANIPRC